MIRRFALLCFTLLLFLILTACEAEVVEVTRVVTEEKVVVNTRIVVVEGEEKVVEVPEVVEEVAEEVVQVTKIVAVEVVVTATPEPEPVELETVQEPVDMFFHDYGVTLRTRLKRGGFF